jgi:hypothetical protein
MALYGKAADISIAPRKVRITRIKAIWSVSPL